MTNEKAIEVIKEECYIASPRDIDRCIQINTALDMAIKALEQIDKIEKEINTPNRGTCDYFIVDRIEEIIDKYKAESDGEV